MPDSDRQLQTFTDVYCIDVSCNSTPVSTLQPTLKGIHVNDNQIFIPHDIIVGRWNDLVLSNGKPRTNNILWWKVFVAELTKSTSNKTRIELAIAKNIFHHSKY